MKRKQKKSLLPVILLWKLCEITVSLLICRNPYGQSVGNHRVGLDHVSRKWGEFLCVCVNHLSHWVVNRASTTRLQLFYIFILAACRCVVVGPWREKNKTKK